MDNVAAPYLKLPVDASAVQSVTRGLVGDTTFAVLPNITPRMSFVLTLAAQIVRSARFTPFFMFHKRKLTRFLSSPLSSSSSSAQHGPTS